jgi:nicotinamide riboside kinase
MKPPRKVAAATVIAPRKVALIGAECTGKTTLAQQLAQALNGVFVPETLREFCDRHARTPTQAEQHEILRDQLQAEHLAMLHARHHAQAWIVCDSAPLMTALYSEVYFADATLWPRALAHHTTYAVTLLMATDLPWQPDGIQRDGPQVQADVHARLTAALQLHGIVHTLIEGDGEQRLERAMQAIAAAQV